MTKVAFIGLGVMGYPMAGHLAQAEHEVTVYNRTAAKAELWIREYTGKSKSSPKEAAQGAEFVFCCVGNDDDVREVVLCPDKGAFAGMSAGATLVDHTTASEGIALELHTEATKHGLKFIDAPVSGGQAGAENGQLAIMCGAEGEADYGAAEAVMACYAKSCVRIGGVGQGQLCKMMNQIAIAGLVQALSESIAFGQQAGVDIPKAMSVIAEGAAGSWQMRNRWQTMLEDEFNFGFAVDWMRKDLGICLDTARKSGAKLPVTALIDQFYSQVQSSGGHRWDTSSLITLLGNKNT